MSNLFHLLFASTFLALSVWQAVEGAFWRGSPIYTTLLVLGAFFIGMAVSERSRRRYVRHLVQLNKLLGSQNEDLCELNLRLLRKLNKGRLLRDTGEYETRPRKQA